MWGFSNPAKAENGLSGAGGQSPGALGIAGDSPVLRVLFLASLRDSQGTILTDQPPDPTGVQAITTLLSALESLAPDVRVNVLDYVLKTLHITMPGVMAAPPSASPPDLPLPPPPAHHAHTPPSTPTDLRSLREQKQPESANQMVAVMAYYLENYAPADQRRDYIKQEDIKKYFPQANFELPTGPHGVTLVNAKNGGYLDMVGAGKYRLNPVGHNLVTHKLPRGDSATNRVGRL
jgi:hypothetical protein